MRGKKIPVAVEFPEGTYSTKPATRKQCVRDINIAVKKSAKYDTYVKTVKKYRGKKDWVVVAKASGPMHEGGTVDKESLHSTVHVFYDGQLKDTIHVAHDRSILHLDRPGAPPYNPPQKRCKTGSSGFTAPHVTKVTHKPFATRGRFAVLANLSDLNTFGNERNE